LANSLLKDGGKLFFEIGAGQSESVKQILNKNNYKNIIVKKDYSDIERIIFGDKT
jgi:release factor glutamine methyltransferase